jgi:hypothetical protein
MAIANRNTFRRRNIGDSEKPIPGAHANPPTIQRASFAFVENRSRFLEGFKAAFERINFGYGYHASSAT